jgi:hypothetical protein
MDGGYLGVGVRGQKPEKVRRDLSLLDLPNRGPARLHPREDGERPLFLECEPDRLTGTARRQLVLAEAREGHQAPALRVQPSPPMGRLDVADVGHAGIGLP